jgi:hypothetical protein
LKLFLKTTSNYLYYATRNSFFILFRNKENFI